MTDPAINDLLQQIDTAAADGRLKADAPANLRNWLTAPYYRAICEERVREAVEASDWEWLNDEFWTRLEFGTGGIRGPMGDLGPATVNERTIAEAAHGMAVYLKKTVPDRRLSAAVAHDTRNSSPEFAELTATTFAAHGITTFLFDGHRATPQLSFAVRRLGCDIGVVISASHNPPVDNGFKAYWSNGAQVISPHDEGIIQEVQRAADIPQMTIEHARQQELVQTVPDDVEADYVAAVDRLSQSTNRNISAVFTPLHGVGEVSVMEVIEAAGFLNVELFEGHRTPNGNFPNVPDQLPNPERIEVFAPVVQWIHRTNNRSRLVLASDPDADRLGVMARDAKGDFEYLTGNQVGALITDYLLRKRRDAGTLSPDDYVVETLVTTPLTARIAESYGARCIRDLLVGFKYIADTMEQEGTEHFVFGMEESIGFLAGDYARDKDGAVAALFILELAGELEAEGKTLFDRLNELFTEHGVHAESQKSIYKQGPTGKAAITALMKALRDAPPRALGALSLVAVADYQAGTRCSLPDGGRQSRIEKPRGNLIVFEAAADDITLQIACRPSGTEPKVKFYSFAQVSKAASADVVSARERAVGALADVENALVEWADPILSQFDE